MEGIGLNFNGHNYIMNNYMSICIFLCHGERVRSHAEAVLKGDIN